jgi:hypothetical protein
MFPWVCQFLLAIHCTLFHDRDPSYSSDLEGSTFFLGVEIKCLLIFEGLLHNCPFFIHANPSKPFVFKMDAFNFSLSVVLSQPKKVNLFHLVGFHSHKFFPIKINYEIHEKELLAIVVAFEELHHLFERSQHEIIMYINHKNLQYFMIICMLNQHQVRWALSLFQFWFVINCCPKGQ